MKEKLIFAVAIFPIAWVTYALNARTPLELGLENFLIWIWCLTFYPVKFFLPHPLIPDYNLPQPVSLTNPEYLFSIILFFLLGFAIWRGRKVRLFIFAAAFYFLSIFFLLKFDNLKEVTVVADRYMYLPSLGICLGLGAWLEHLSKRTNQAGLNLALAALVIVSF